MLWLIPHLFPDPRLLEIAAHDLRLPGLQTLLARGTPTAKPPLGTEAALCRALGIARQQDWPLAPITLEADGGQAGGDYWLRADPVYLHLMRDRIVLAGGSLTDLTLAEAETLAHDIALHFEGRFALEARRPQRWYLRLSLPLRLVTAPPSLATGRALDDVWPQGEDAATARRWLNELQMLLHAHPVNQAREARGALPVNSVWLWGGGVLATRPTGPVPPVYAEDAEAHALTRYCASALSAVPPALDAGLLDKPGVLLLDALCSPAVLGDTIGWRAALRALEEHWFAPLLRALPKAGREGVRLFDPVSGHGLDLSRRDAWKVWRRPGQLASGLRRA